MKVSREQAEKNRARVVETAGAQFRAHGFDGIGVADLMKSAGLTHGGFYGNFASKNELAVEAVTAALAKVAALMREVTEAAPDRFAAIVTYYLSEQHRDDIAGGCVMAALAADGARGDGRLRGAFEAGARLYIDLLTPLVDGAAKTERRERATAVYATMVGALVLSRAVADPALSSSILSAARAQLLGARKSAA